MEYRIYDTRDKCYLEESDGKWMLTRSGLIYSVERDKYYNNGERYLIERFTGLKDKNGKEIFEGDHFGNEDFPVVFKNGSFCLGSLPLDGYLNGSYLEQVDFVIGNIHETENK